MEYTLQQIEKKLELKGYSVEEIQQAKELLASEEKIRDFMQSELNPKGRIIQIMYILITENIPQIENACRNHFAILRNGRNIERWINPYYTFQKFKTYKEDHVVEDKGKWQVHPILRQEVLEGMNQDWSPEEKGIYLYTRLCQILTYDEEYVFERFLTDKRFTGQIPDEALEQISPSNNRVLCFEFCKIAAKLLNEVEGITTKVIAEGINEGHYCFGYYTNNVSVILEAVSGLPNDLAKAKLGLPLGGINVVSDKEKRLPTIIKNMQQQANQKDKQRNHLTSLLERYKEVREKPIKPNDENFMQNFKTFRKELIEKKITGNDAIQYFILLQHTGYFGKQIEFALMGKKVQRDDRKEGIGYERKLVIRQKQEGNKPISRFLIFDPKTLKIDKIPEKVVHQNKQEGNWVYENEDYRI